MPTWEILKKICEYNKNLSKSKEKNDFFLTIEIIKGNDETVRKKRKKNVSK